MGHALSHFGARISLFALFCKNWIRQIPLKKTKLVTWCFWNFVVFFHSQVSKIAKWLLVQTNKNKNDIFHLWEVDDEAISEQSVLKVVRPIFWKIEIRRREFLIGPLFSEEIVKCIATRNSKWAILMGAFRNADGPNISRRWFVILLIIQRGNKKWLQMFNTKIKDIHYNLL